MNKHNFPSLKSCWSLLAVFLLSILSANVTSADSWVFTESGYTSGCETGCAPGTQCNGPYHAGFTLDVSTYEGKLRGIGWCVGQPFCDPPLPTYLYGSISSSNASFMRWGPGFTPGFTIKWNYSGTLQGSKLTGSFGGPGDQRDHYAKGCYTKGTFQVTVSKGNSSISGRIALPNGVGFSAANVYAYSSRCSSGVVLGGARTYGLGEYTITGLSPGNYYVMASSSTSNHIPTWWDGGSGTQRCENALKVDLEGYENRTGIDIVLENGGSVSGTISNSSGTPIDGQIIYATLDRCNTQTRIATEGTSSSSGSYMIQGLPEGSVYLFTYRILDNDQTAAYWWNKEGGYNDCGFAEPAHILVNQNNPGYDFVLP